MSSHVSLQDACNVLQDRLKPLRASRPGASWEQLVSSSVG